MGKLILIATIVSVGLCAASHAQEKDVTSPIVAVSKDAKVKLGRGMTLAVFLNGNDVLLTRIAEDALTIYLIKAGFSVVSREKLEGAVGEQVDKSRKENKAGALNALDVGKAINASHVITGTLVLEYGEQKSALVRVASFQLLDVGSGQVVINALFEPAKGEPLSQTAGRFVDVLKVNAQ